MTGDANFQVTSSSMKKKNSNSGWHYNSPLSTLSILLRLIDFIIGFFPLKNTQQGNGSIFSTGVFLSFDHLSVCIQDIKRTSTGSTPNHFKPNTPQDTATPRNPCYTVKYQSTHGVNLAVLQQPVGTYRMKLQPDRRI